MTHNQWKRAFLGACEEGHLSEVARWVTDHESLAMNIANPHMEQEIGLFLAVEGGYLDVVKYLLTSKDMHDWHGFIKADDPHHQSLLVKACRHGHLNIIEFLTTSKELLDAGHPFFDIEFSSQKNEDHEDAVRSCQGLLEAMIHGHYHVLDFFLKPSPWTQAGHAPLDWQINNHFLLRWALKTENAKSVEYFLKDPYFTKGQFCYGVSPIQEVLGDWRPHGKTTRESTQDDFFLNLWEDPCYEEFGLSDAFLESVWDFYLNGAAQRKNIKVLDWMLNSKRIERIKKIIPMEKVKKNVSQCLFWCLDTGWLEGVQTILQGQEASWISDVFNEKDVNILGFRLALQGSKKEIAPWVDILRWLVEDYDQRSVIEPVIQKMACQYEAVQKVVGERDAWRQKQELNGTLEGSRDDVANTNGNKEHGFKIKRL